MGMHEVGSPGPGWSTLTRQVAVPSSQAAWALVKAGDIAATSWPQSWVKTLTPAQRGFPALQRWCGAPTLTPALT